MEIILHSEINYYVMDYVLTAFGPCLRPIIWNNVVWSTKIFGECVVKNWRTFLDLCVDNFIGIMCG